jgi:hypothetical protein
LAQNCDRLHQRYKLHSKSRGNNILNERGKPGDVSRLANHSIALNPGKPIQDLFSNALEYTLPENKRRYKFETNAESLGLISTAQYLN